MAQYSDTILFVVFLVFSIAAAIQIFYYLYFYLSVYLYKHEETRSSGQPVSVIICARNEAENLRKFLPSVLEQDYPDYEVIIVNDCSEDNSYDVLGSLLSKYPHLKISTVNKDPKFTHNKKFAQFIGIKAAKNEILLFTDADCEPLSNKWLEKMTAHFTPETNFVLGYGGYRKEGGLLNKFIRYDSLTIAMQYLGMAIKGIPYMGVGRNLAYRRSVFFENKGFGTHAHLISGDDDLFVNTNASGTNTCVEFSPDTHTLSVPGKRVTEWLTQKKRHLTTAPYYKFRDRFLLLTEIISRVILYASFVVLLSFSFLWPFAIVIFSLRLIAMITIIILVSKKLNETGLAAYSLFFDIFSPVINSILFFGRLRNGSGKNRWK